MKTLLQDLRYGARVLTRARGFTFVAIITLALGIGANTAIFSVVNAVLLRPLPFTQPDRLAMANTTNLGRGFTDFGTSMPDFRLWRERNQSFEKLAAYDSQSFNISGTTEPERVTGAVVSANLFTVFGTEPARGRFFNPSDEQAGHAPVAVISNALWQRRFGAEEAIVGKPITLDGSAYTVVGIAPAGFQFPNKTDVWVPPYRLAPTMKREQILLVNLSGRGDKDVNTVERRLAREETAQS